MTMRQSFLECGHATAKTLTNPAVAKAWDHDSALPEFSIAGLAGHTAFQVFSVRTALDPVDPGDTPLVALMDHYRKAAWRTTPITSQANTRIREVGDEVASEGPQALAKSLTTALDELAPQLDDLENDHVIYVPNWGYRVSLEDYLLTRVMEMVVHLDDLAVSADIEPVELSDGTNRHAIALLSDLATLRHGSRSLVRAFARSERSTGDIAAF